jgi:hypothetical protein
MYKEYVFASKKESATLYMNLLSILKLDNVFKLKIAIFTYKIINEDKNIPRIFINIISTAATQHSYSTRFAEKQNFIIFSVLVLCTQVNMIFVMLL